MRDFMIIGATDRQPRNEYYDILSRDEAARLARAQGYYYCYHRDRISDTGGKFDFGNTSSGPFFAVERTIQARKGPSKDQKRWAQAGRIAAQLGGIWFGNPEAFTAAGEAWKVILTDTPQLRGFRNDNHPSTAREWTQNRDFHLSTNQYWNCIGVVRFKLN